MTKTLDTDNFCHYRSRQFNGLGVVSMAAPLGNQNAAKGKRFQKAMERVLARKYGDVDSGYEAIAKIYIEIAESKDPSICKDIADRVDGKPNQAIELSGEVGSYVARTPNVSPNADAWAQSHAPAAACDSQPSKE